MSDRPIRLPVRVALRRHVIAQVEALAQLARDLGMDVREDAPRGQRVGTFHNLSTPVYVVTGHGGKQATITLTGGESPAPTVIFRDPARAATTPLHTAILSLTLPTVHVFDAPPATLEAVPA